MMAIRKDKDKKKKKEKDKKALLHLVTLVHFDLPNCCLCVMCCFLVFLLLGCVCVFFACFFPPIVFGGVSLFASPCLVSLAILMAKKMLPCLAGMVCSSQALCFGAQHTALKEKRKDKSLEETKAADAPLKRPNDEAEAARSAEASLQQHGHCT